MVATDTTLHREVDEILPGVIADRRHLHQHPELGFQEHETAKFVVERLQALGAEEIKPGIGRTGVTALIRGSLPGKTVALRADMDALPIVEENDVEYKSQHNGVMHACGHDSHVAMLLGTARMLQQMRDRFAGTVKLIFQPGEEGLGGAMEMIKDGALENPAPDAIFGIHIWQGLDLGVVAARPGTAMVAADGFIITIHGLGGHGAQPHLCIDPIAVGAQIVTALQTIVARELDPTLPGVVTVGAFHAGEASNVIPETAELRGTIRAVTQDQREMLAKRIEEITQGIATAMRATIEVKITFGVPPTVNDAAMTEIVKSAAREVVGDEGTIDGPLMVVSEDMSEFLNRVPGCFYFVGSQNAERGLTWGHHHPRFDIDEEAMAIGIETMTRTVLKYLAE
jgi:amidohydrolase